MNFSKEKSCYRDLNSGPLPYQGSALPLSYNSKWSGKRDSNPRPPAWKASALSTELFPQRWVGKDGFEPPKAKASRFTVCPIWPLWNLPVTSKVLPLCIPNRSRETAAKVGLFFYVQNFSDKKSTCHAFFLCTSRVGGAPHPRTSPRLPQTYRRLSRHGIPC